jgi:pyruvate kinase
MTMARLSMAHDNYSAHTHTISFVREACQQFGISIPILQDLQGPKLRIGKINVKLSKGQVVILTPVEHPDSTEETQSSQNIGKKAPAFPSSERQGWVHGVIPNSEVRIPNFVHIPLIGDIHQHVKVGDLVLINNGIVQLEVKEVHGVSTVCEVKCGGVVRTEKGVNLPMTNLPTKSITPKDKEDLVFGLQHQVEWIALSFVKSANDITELREWLLKQNPKRMPLVMSKIETREAIENLFQIIEVSDAVMVARGDMALEISFTKLPFLQKRIISECRSFGKPVIVATDFMDSMCHRRVPSRAEVMDVANAFLDGATGILLSQETAVGSYPVETVEMVSNILSEVKAKGQDGKMAKWQACPLALLPPCHFAI